MFRIYLQLCESGGLQTPWMVALILPPSSMQPSLIESHLLFLFQCQKSYCLDSSTSHILSLAHQAFEIFAQSIFWHGFYQLTYFEHHSNGYQQVCSRSFMTESKKIKTEQEMTKQPRPEELGLQANAVFLKRRVFFRRALSQEIR